jgi:drug/metabolite transporter (DMT)-like permease
VKPPGMTATRLVSITFLAMLAFAGNSILCRLALRLTSIDAGSFTAIRLLSGAMFLCTFAWLVRRKKAGQNTESPAFITGLLQGSWTSGCVLFLYAETFSFAYVSLPAGVGALLLFGAVQATMILTGLWCGERLRWSQYAGLGLALAGLVIMMLPGLSSPSQLGALLMIVAGVAWGVYSLLGRHVIDPLAATAGSFLRAAPMSLLLSALTMTHLRLDIAGAAYAVLSGVITSGIGYVVWYAALRGLSATRAASVQLSVPVLVAFGGVLFLDEAITLRLMIACAAILGGIALVVRHQRGAPSGSGV